MSISRSGLLNEIAKAVQAYGDKAKKEIDSYRREAHFLWEILGKAVEEMEDDQLERFLNRLFYSGMFDHLK